MSDRLHILCLFDRVDPEYMGGIEHRNLELATALGRRGHRVTLAGWASRPSSPAPGVDILPLRPLRPPADFYNDRGVRSRTAAIALALDAARVDLGPYDVVETTHLPYLHLFPLAVRCRRASKPLCVTWYEYWGSNWEGYIRGPAWRVYAGLERATVDIGDVAVASSELTRRRLASHRRDEVRLIPIGVPVDAIRAAARASTRPGPHPPLVFAGRLIKEKRVDLLLHAVRRLLERGLEGPLLTVIGDGPDAERLRGLAADLKIADAVSFAGYVPSNEDVWARIGQAKVAVQPSSREGYGLFPLESLAAGLPVVYCASDDSAVGEIVRDGVEGIRTDPEPDALAAALGELIAPGSQQRLDALAAAALERGSSFSWDAVAATTEQLYERLASRR